MRPSKYLFALCIGLYGSISANPGCAEVSVMRLDDTGRFATIAISGVISKSDASRFNELTTLLRPHFEVLEVELNSPGGSVPEAMEMGERIRKDWLWTVVDDDAKCWSACVFILAAGAKRIAGVGTVGIHRPHFDAKLFAGLDRAEAKSRYDQLSEGVRRYLDIMGMSEPLFRAMMAIPSSEVRIVRYDEMKEWGLVGEDPGYAEWLKAKNIPRRER